MMAQKTARARARGATIIYGGSFDPPHMGHQMACLYLAESLGAAAVWVMPAAAHPLHKPLRPFAQRLAMTRLMAAPLGGRVSVHETEATLGGKGRTYDLLCHLRQAHPDRPFVLAIGADLLPQLPIWHRSDELVAETPIVVLGREGHTGTEEGVLRLPQVASSSLRDDLARGVDVTGRVSLRVAEYIEAHGLYRS